MPSRAYVAAFGFKGPDQQKPAGVLSGGERNRLNLALTLKQGGNLLLLDEPTNDLDVETLTSLEGALLEFPGCAVVVSHDRWFLDRVATHILAYEGESKWFWFEGNFQDYEKNKVERLGHRGDPPAPGDLPQAQPRLSRRPPGAPRITARSRQPYGRVSGVRHTVQVPMRWSDMDAYQHINNVAFLGYFEMARVNLFFEHPTHDEKTGMRRGLVVHSHEITYKRPVVYDAEPLEIQIWVSSIRAASFLCHYEAFDHGQLAVTGQTMLVPFDFSLNRPRRITPEEKEFLARFADEGVPVEAARTT